MRPPLFPVMYDRRDAPGPTGIPWSVADKAYSVYTARYGRDQSLEHLARRGGFGANEMDLFLPGWREEVSELAAIRQRVERLEGAIAAFVRDCELTNTHANHKALCDLNAVRLSPTPAEKTESQS